MLCYIILKVALTRKLPYDIDKTTLHTALQMDANSLMGFNSGWPEQFVPQNKFCQLCASPLSEPMSHQGQNGKSYLLTELNPFMKIEIKVKVCRNGDCKAMHQAFSTTIGEF